MLPGVSGIELCRRLRSKTDSRNVPIIMLTDERTVDVHIGRLRKALIRGNERDPIRTVRSAGYVFGDRADA